MVEVKILWTFWKHQTFFWDKNLLRHPRPSNQVCILPLAVSKSTTLRRRCTCKWCGARRLFGYFDSSKENWPLVSWERMIYIELGIYWRKLGIWKLHVGISTFPYLSMFYWYWNEWYLKVSHIKISSQLARLDGGICPLPNEATLDLQVLLGSGSLESIQMLSGVKTNDKPSPNDTKSLWHLDTSDWFFSAQPDPGAFFLKWSVPSW